MKAWKKPEHSLALEGSSPESWRLEGNPAFPKSGSLKPHLTVFLIMNILFQSPGTPLGSVSGLGLIPGESWAGGLAGSARTRDRGYTAAHIGLDTSPQFLP